MRSVSGTGNRHPIPTDRVPSVAMNGWNVAHHWAAGDDLRAQWRQKSEWRRRLND